MNDLRTNRTGPASRARVEADAGERDDARSLNIVNYGAGRGVRLSGAGSKRPKSTGAHTTWLLSRLSADGQGL